MPFKLIVVNTGEEASAAPNAFVFNKDRVTIGREADNDLPLADHRRVVSKQHAEVVRQGNTFQVRDLGSKNFTYLNGTRLESGQGYGLAPGDTVQIGEFELRLELVDVPTPQAAPFSDASDRTVFAMDFVNPFEEGASLLGVALRDLEKQYKQSTPNRRDDALQEALRKALEGGGQDLLDTIALLSGGTTLRPASRVQTPPAAPPEAPMPPPPVTPQQGGLPWDLPAHPPAASPAASPPPAEVPTYTPPAYTPPQDAWPPAFDSSPAATRVGSQGMTGGVERDRMSQVLDAALQAMAKLLGIPWQFRHEFIGQTIMHAEEASFLYDGDAALLKRRLLDPSISKDEAQERLALFAEGADTVGLHLLALLDGYKASVQEGARHLIDQLHPEALVEEEKKGALRKLLPVLAKAAALERMQQQLQELRQEDWSATERRTYRPAFIKAYLARLTALERSPR